MKTRSLVPRHLDSWSLRLTCVLWIGFALLAVLAAGSGNINGDVRLLAWFQGQEWSVLESLARATNWFFDGRQLTIAGIALVAGLFLLGRRVDGCVLAFLIAVRVVNGLLKNLVESPRPGPGFMRDGSQASGFGFPSGHTAGAVLICGGLAWVMSRNRSTRVKAVASATSTLIVAVTGFGRMWVGAHWPSDVLGGVLWSLPVVILATYAASRHERRHPAANEHSQS